jgi:hypothetical protein
MIMNCESLKTLTGATDNSNFLSSLHGESDSFQNQVQSFTISDLEIAELYLSMLRPVLRNWSAIFPCG